MYIEGKYWNNYVGDTDDSLTLVDYLAYKRKKKLFKKEITLKEIFADTGLDKLNGDFRQADSLSVDIGIMEAEIYYAIDLITDLAAILLECKKNGSVKLSELSDDDDYKQTICITATQEEHELINKTLKDFVAEPLEYNLCEVTPEDGMQEMAEICENLRKELYE